ncbi:MFS transporter [Amycolatopsis regifaucium]|uniref:Transporter n=1 Tax=Amycolatopsis regifaucium TaxID=546365 RepID=A0A154MNV4_9PSEU|nr:MFS transporter [Amycolatopsis regifaucium]KZB85998.1 transporter [Amycolatopsis regifaucium]OKA04889.1 MFS transporter [Amycolatopsis regifaucium]
MTTTRTEPPLLARATVLGAATLTIMAAAIIAPSLPAMSRAFDADVLVRLALTITSLAIAVSAPLAGAFADRTGRRPLLITALLLYAVSGTAGFFVTDLAVLLISRALLGLAVGGIMTAVSALITDWFDGPRRAAFLGLQQAFASLGGVVFLPLAGVLAGIDWRAPFWLYSVAVVVALAALAGLRDEPRVKIQGGVFRPAAKALGIYAVALVATLVFFMAPTQLPFLLSELSVGPGVIGVVIAGSTLTSVIGALVFPRLRWGPRTITASSIALLGVGWLLAGTGTVAGIVAGLLVGGIGVGIVVPHLNVQLSGMAAPQHRGRILSGLVAGIFLGQFLSPLVVAPLVQAAGIAGAFVWTGVFTTVGALGALVTKEKK